MTSRMPAILSTVDLPLAELMCARLDGEVYPLGECWCPIDEVEGAPARAASLSPLVPRRAIVERYSAAWIYGIVPEPAQHQICVDIGARTRATTSGRVQLREVVCPESDTRSLVGVRVTTPIRTVIDLARWAPREPEDGLTPLLLALLRYGGYTDTAFARQRCEAKSVPNRILALARLVRVERLFAELSGCG